MMRCCCVSSNYAGWKDTLDTVFEALILGALMEFCGMSSLDAEPTRNTDTLDGTA